MRKPRENLRVRTKKTGRKLYLPSSKGYAKPRQLVPFTKYDDDMGTAEVLRQMMEHESPINRVVLRRRPRNSNGITLAFMALYLAVTALMAGVEHFYYGVYPYRAFGLLVAFLVVTAGKSFADLAREERDDKRDERREAVEAEYPAFFRAARSRAVIAIFEEMT